MRFCAIGYGSWQERTCVTATDGLPSYLRREGWHVNAKRIYRLYREEELIVRTKQRRKMARRRRVATPTVATRPNQSWGMDFVSDKLADGGSFRILTVVDQFARACVGLAADRSLK